MTTRWLDGYGSLVNPHLVSLSFYNIVVEEVSVCSEADISRIGGVLAGQTRVRGSEDGSQDDQFLGIQPTRLGRICCDCK